MKTKVMFTVSDINGSKQYNLYELIQRFLPWIMGFTIVNLFVGALIVSILK